MIVDDFADPGLRDAARLLTVPPPPIDARMAEAVLRDQYGLVGVASRLAGERDRNFLVELDDGAYRILKFFSEVDDAATRDFQHGALIHLEAAAVRCRGPQLLRTLDGAAECTATAAGLDRPGILISFLPGVASQTVRSVRALRLDVGRTAAELGLALRRFSHAAAGRVLLWDHMRLDRLQPLTGLIDDARRRAWIERRIDRFVSELRPAAARLPSQIIHNDMSGSNVLVHAADPATVSGVIDFGDMVRGPRINEIAVAASYLVPAAPDYASALSDLVEGYETVSGLEEREVALLHDLVMARLAIRALIPRWRAALFPDNRDYILRHSEAGGRLIDWFAAQDDAAQQDAVLAHWRRRRMAG